MLLKINMFNVYVSVFEGSASVSSNQPSTSPALSVNPACIDAVCSSNPCTPFSTTQQSVSPTPPLIQRHTTGNIQSSCPSTAFSPPRPPVSPSIYLIRPAGHPDPQLKESHPSGLWWNTRGSLELIDSHKKEMELRVTAGRWWGVTVALQCFTLVTHFRWSASSFCHVCLPLKIRVGSSGFPFQKPKYFFFGF